MPWRDATPEDEGHAYECGCWIWTGYTDAKGVPVRRTATSNTTAARALWERRNGPVPDGLLLGSLCGNRLCVRVNHREPMTRSEIAYTSGQTKLTRRLRKRAWALAARGVPKRRIAEAMNVDPATIGRIAKGQIDPIKGHK